MLLDLVVLTNRLFCYAIAEEESRTDYFVSVLLHLVVFDKHHSEYKKIKGYKH